MIQQLQSLCIDNISRHWQSFTKKGNRLPEVYLFDLLECCMENERVSIIHQIFLSKETFLQLVDAKDRFITLYKSLQILIDNGIHIHNELTKLFIREGKKTDNGKLIKVCEFLMECGWYTAAAKLLNHLYHTMNALDDRYNVLVVLTHLISTNIAECKFKEAKVAFVKASSFYDPLKDKQFNAGLLYGEECFRHYCLSNFTEADEWADRALFEISESLNTAACITVLRRTAKVYINTRRFDRAEAIIRHAVDLAGSMYGTNHPQYADTLQDYAFCLLHLDLVSECVVVYNKAVDIIDVVFGDNNMKTAIAHEDLAYATYVYDYNNGNYAKSLEHAERSIAIVNNLLAPDHLLHASTSRLRALILEELAFDEINVSRKDKLLKEAQELHNRSLKLCRSILGEDNIQTAKHYGNLGRLYQSMSKYESAEKMHCKAIQIKESLLGPDNFELALSLGHLASLYNYDMKRHDDALPLYHRSIDIALRMFGPGFSGLEYDYNGLIHLYTVTKQPEKSMLYLTKLHQWRDLREAFHERHQHEDPLSTAHSVRSTSKVLHSILQKT